MDPVEPSIKTFFIKFKNTEKPPKVKSFNYFSAKSIKWLND